MPLPPAGAFLLSTDSSTEGATRCFSTIQAADAMLPQLIWGNQSRNVAAAAKSTLVKCSSQAISDQSHHFRLTATKLSKSKYKLTIPIHRVLPPQRLMTMKKDSTSRQKILKAQLEHLAHEVKLIAGKRTGATTADRSSSSGSRFKPIDEYDSIRPLWRSRSH